MVSKVIVLISVDSLLVKLMWDLVAGNACQSAHIGQTLKADTLILKSGGIIFLVYPQIIWPLGLDISHENSTG